MTIDWQDDDKSSTFKADKNDRKKVALFDQKI